MSLNHKLTTAAAQFSTWTAQHPLATRALMLGLPILAAAVAAVVTGQPVYACSAGGSVGGGCGGG